LIFVVWLFVCCDFFMGGGVGTVETGWIRGEGVGCWIMTVETVETVGTCILSTFYPWEVEVVQL